MEDCFTCRHRQAAPHRHPCATCADYSNWREVATDPEADHVVATPAYQRLVADLAAEQAGSDVDQTMPQPDRGVKSAPEFLTKAAHLMAERGKQYDASGSERSMGKAIRAFNAITGHELREPEGWLLLQVLKDVRLFTKPGYHQDSAEDCIAYAALKAEAKQIDGGQEA